jgi:hypothetical protein
MEARRTAERNARRAPGRFGGRAGGAAPAPLLAELRDNGKSLYGIAAELNRLDVETPNGGRKWTQETVRNLFVWSGEALPLRTRRHGARRALI